MDHFVSNENTSFENNVPCTLIMFIFEDGREISISSIYVPAFLPINVCILFSQDCS
jgi:hypothetical protein